MIHEIGREHALRRLFCGLVEQVFMTDLGVCETAVTGYLSDMLIEFLHVDQIHRLHTVDGRTIREVSRMQAEAHLGGHADISRRNRFVHKYIGDFTLFWTGIYPEHLMRRRHGSDLIQEYLLQGKRSYNIASELSREDDKPPADVLRNLGEQFEYCVQGLHLVREAWEGIAPPGSEN